MIRHLVLGETYANICCEIISSAIPSILETLVYENKELLQVYWALLYQDYRLTGLQITHFVKINQVLINRRPGDMVRFITTTLSSSDDLLSHWIYHFADDQGCQLVDLFISLIQCELNYETGGIVKWLHEKGLTALLMKQLHPSNDSMMHQYSQQVLCDIIRLSQSSHRNLISIGKNGLINEFVSEEVMTQLVDYMLDSESSESVDTFLCGSKLIINLIRYNDERYLNDKDNDDTISLNPIEEPGENESPQNSKILSTMLSACTLRLADFLKLLKEPRSKCGKRFGMERLTLLELLAEWIHCSNLSGLSDTGHEFKLMYCQQNTIIYILDLFFDFPSCNIAHNVICDIIGQIMENKYLDKNINRQMILQLFTHGKLIQRILQANEYNQTYGGPRLGYMGHLKLLTKSIVQLLNSQPDLKNKIIEYDGDLDFEQWITFSNDTMNELHKLELPLVHLPGNTNENNNLSSNNTNESSASSSTVSLTSSSSSSSSSIPFYTNTPSTSLDILPGIPFLTPPPPVHSPITSSPSSSKFKLKHV
ncbi:unnamed protein product [Cunninghamella blakesleeana]